jgi:GT2 family glycosyltransferase
VAGVRGLGALSGVPAVGWRGATAAARKLRKRKDLDFIPPWESSILDDTALNRPLNLAFRPMRALVQLRAEERIPGLRLRPGVTIAIVNWNSVDLLKDVLRAIERFGSPRNLPLEVLVIDNGSSDGSREFLKECRKSRRVRCFLSPQNLFHGPAMDLAFLLSRTEYVIALDVDAFPIGEGWLEALLGPLQQGRSVSGAEAARGYIHPCCLAMRTEDFAVRRHTFTPHIGTWDPERRGIDEWDTGESITRREGLENVAALPRTRVRGPLQLGSVFGDVVYHNGASTRLRSDVEIGGLTRSDTESAWREALAEYLDEPGAPMVDDSVTVHVANLNTEHATELCIRSMRHFAGRPFDLVVGDSGSTDGSVEMLRRWQDLGWLRLEEAPHGRAHSSWIDGWLASCTTRFAVFSDSDVEYREHGWLDDMVNSALRTGSAMVCARMLMPTGLYVHPVTGAMRELALRPSPWLLLIDLEQVRGRVDASFELRDVKDPNRRSGGISYDVGATYFRALCDAGLTWTEMPVDWRRKYRHFGGLTWLKDGAAARSARVRAKQLTKLAIVESRRRRVRALGWGEEIPEDVGEDWTPSETLAASQR